jgi:hypothetical protein
MTKKGPSAGKVLESDDMAALFGLEMGEPVAAEAVPVTVAMAPTVRKAAAAPPKPATLKSAPAKKKPSAKKPAPAVASAQVHAPQSRNTARAARK